MLRLLIVITAVLVPFTVFAHDTWVEANTALVRLSDVVFVDLKLGNHGNDHRDFKLASKISLGPCQLSVIGPDGKVVDLKSGLIDTGYTAKEGYWCSRFVPKIPGLYVVSHTVESSHGTTRGIKSGKTYFQASPHLDDIPSIQAGFDKPLGHAIELVPLMNPISATGPNQPIRVKLYYRSKPLAGARVSFIPRGTVLAEGFDKDFEAMTDSDGVASFTPKEGNIVLIAVHHMVPDEKGDGYDKTQYTATLTVSVPQLARSGATKLSSK